VIALKAVNAVNEETLAEEVVEADSKEQVLTTLGGASTAMRGKLGESLTSLNKFDTPLQEATTSSLDALKAYSVGLAQYSKGDPTSSIPLFKHAIELDPEFATAYAALGRAYEGSGDAALTVAAIRKAYALRNRASEREKLDISAVYYQFGTGQIDQAIESCQLWDQTYPRDFVPHRILGYEYATLGQWEASAQEFEEANRLDPTQFLPYLGLTQDYMALNRLADAHAIIHRAQAHGVFRGAGNYSLAFLEGDTGTMARITASQADPDEMAVAADTEAYFGHAGKARELTRRAAAAALTAGAMEASAGIEGGGALNAALFGNAAEARQYIQAALRHSVEASGHTNDNSPVPWLGVLALAIVGDTARAGKLADQLAEGFPSDTVIHRLWLPEIRSVIQLNGGKPLQAVDELLPAEAMELSWVPPQLMPPYLRGQAFLEAHRGTEAATEFEKILDHPGIVLNSRIGPLARLGLARAYVLQGETAKAKAAYRDFLALWKDADPDIPILKQAKAEYAKLQ
jgi:tetratricopeptide (TPR) repeat protein